MAAPGRPAPTPTTTTMSGLRVVDDYEFQVTLSEPFSVFPTMVGYWAFQPDAGLVLPGPLELHTNVESGARVWMDAVGQGITAALGIGCETMRSQSFGEFRQAIVFDRSMTGAYRSDWRADYLSIENFLTPRYRTGASSNDSGYSNPAVPGALVAAVTERVAIRAGSVVAPLHHPARIAEEWAVVDNLSDGRLGISFTSGRQTVDFALRPENYPRRTASPRRIGWRSSLTGLPANR